MKTYKTTIEKPQLIIEYGQTPFSPREWCNESVIATYSRDYHSIDTTDEAQEIIDIMLDKQEESDSAYTHFELIKKELQNKYKLILPVSKYEHGSINYSIGINQGFDSCFCGVYCTNENITHEQAQKELDIYNQYLNGEVYEFVLYDKNGEEIDSCSGFYDIDEIKNYLPSEWKNEDLAEYLTF